MQSRRRGPVGASTQMGTNKAMGVTIWPAQRWARQELTALNENMAALRRAEKAKQARLRHFDTTPRLMRNGKKLVKERDVLMESVEQVSARIAADPSVDARRLSYQQSQHLEAFWKRAQQARTRAERLTLLGQMAALRLTTDPYHNPTTQQMRRHFEKLKSRGHHRLRGWCWVCAGETPDHRHHIIQITNGGRNRADNRVFLCAQCHRDVHRIDRSEHA